MHHTITEIQSMGIRVASGLSGRKGGAGPADGKAFIIDEKVVMVPLSGFYVARSPYLLCEDEQGYLLFKEDKPVTRLKLVPEPEFYNHNSDDGVPFKKIALLHGRDCLATTVLQRCFHWKRKKRCAFCATEASLEGNATEAVKTPSQLAQAAAAAHKMDGIRHVVLTSGTGDPPGSEIPYLARCTRAIKDKVNIPVQVQFAPPQDLDLMEMLHDAGADAAGIHVESFDPAVLDRIAPAKAEIGLAHYEKAWKRAVELFGVNQVSSFLISGLGETPASIAWGSEYLADLGVFPFVVPLRPIPGSRLQHLTPPDSEQMKRVYHAVANILSQKGLSTKATRAGCVRCGACSGLPGYESLMSSHESHADDIICHSARTIEERENAFEIRRQVFVDEQGLFKDSDLDENDNRAIHLVAEKQGNIIGSVRVFRTAIGSDHWIGGRLAVIPSGRRTHAGALLVKEAMKRVKKLGCQCFTADIQEKNISFFKKLGWYPIGEIRTHYGVPHMRMQADLNCVPEDLK